LTLKNFSFFVFFGNHFLMAEFYDTHAHLDFPDFAPDLEAVVNRAAEAGITRLINIGTDLESSKRAVSLSEKFEQVYAVAGWHPSHVTGAPGDVREALRELARHPKVVAIGETGLDYHRLPSGKPGGMEPEDKAYKQRQADLFRQQIEVAAEFGLNCVVHQRDAFEDTMRLLQPYAAQIQGVFHCFGGTAEAMERVLNLGFLVSFTGIISFKNAQSVRETVAATPLDQFMLETDCPFLAPVPYRGKRCEPAYVREIAQFAAQAKNCTLEELSEATCATARRFFPRLR
jgi:TatD DNase family protein